MPQERKRRKGKKETRGRPTTANLGATTPRLRAGWTGMLDGTSRPTNPEYEPDGIHQEGGAASPGCDEPDPVTSRLA